MLTAWSGDTAAVKRLSLRNHAPAFAGAEIIVRGTVASVVSNDGTCEADHSGVYREERATEVVSGEAVVRLA